MPHEWVKWGEKRVRTRQEQHGIARRSFSSQTLPLSNVTLVLHRRTKQQVVHGPFSSYFTISNSVLIVLNVGRSDFLSQRKKHCIIFLHLSLLNGKEKSPAVFRKPGKVRTLASHSSSFLVYLCC